MLKQYYEFNWLFNNTGCSTRYRTRDFLIILPRPPVCSSNKVPLVSSFFDKAKKYVLLFKFRCNIFIGVRIIKEMPGSVASETPCINYQCKE
jgi:hypothetical protein